METGQGASRESPTHAGRQAHADTRRYVQMHVETRRCTRQLAAIADTHRHAHILTNTHRFSKLSTGNRNEARRRTTARRNAATQLQTDIRRCTQAHAGACVNPRRDMHAHARRSMQMHTVTCKRSQIFTDAPQILADTHVPADMHRYPPIANGAQLIPTAKHAYPHIPH